MDEARLLGVVFKVVVGIFPIEEVVFSAYTPSLIAGVFFLLVDGSCMVRGDTGGLGDRGIEEGASVTNSDARPEENLKLGLVRRFLVCVQRCEVQPRSR